MIKLRTLWRLIRLSAWTPPAGLRWNTVVDFSEGTLDVLLDHGMHQANLTLMPGARFDLNEIFIALDDLAAHMVKVAAREAERAEDFAEKRRVAASPEDNVVRDLDLYGLAFEARIARSPRIAKAENTPRKGSR